MEWWHGMLLIGFVVMLAIHLVPVIIGDGSEEEGDNPPRHRHRCGDRNEHFHDGDGVD